MEASLQEILDARERRARHQQALLKQYRRPLICFAMNIPGPEKCSAAIEEAFHLGEELILSQLDGEGIALLWREEYIFDTGCEAYFVADAPAEAVKALTMELEDGSELARLYDMDVLEPGGRKLSREEFGCPERRCLLCGGPARVCARSRSHGLEALQKEVNRRLTEALTDRRSRILGGLAQKSLLYEVCVSPKPGLVDRYNSGAHTDMDIFTFLDSAAVLRPYFENCVRIGMETAKLPPAETFRALRLPGRLAQRQMEKATGGVNTHKGAIFTLGILCGALGRLDKEACREPEAVLAQCAAMTQGLTRQAFEKVTEENAATAGEYLYAKYGITGVRGQAEAGFPAVLHTGLPVLEEGLENGLSLNDAGCAALLAMMTATVDTNLVARSSLQTQRQVCREVALLLARNRYPDRETLEVLDARFRKENLSPGGTADLLAVTYLLHFLKTEY